ncbi:cell division protein ZapE [Burkholderia sp. 22PA0106]|uniref:cell division protein ZapE n=1 Tax=Burkholderia sp. 22PA0106 TaxID=3237371 RepID=UPI0039C22087
MPTLPAWLTAEFARRRLTLDADQSAAAAQLDALLAGRLPEATIGAYCYGPPGRGKSLLAALFHEAWPGPRVRTHFHAFLRDVNRRLVAAPPSDDKLGDVLAQWLGESRLLWFDEFHVHDIADALILAALLRVAIARRVYLLFTSNQPPAGLLPDPEFHHRFEPTIALLNAHCLMLPFEGAVDYRRVREPAGAAAAETAASAFTHDDTTIAALFARHGDAIAARDTIVPIANRPLAARAAGTHTLLCNFDALCAQARSHLDYLDLAARYRVLILDAVALDAETPRAVLQRFVWLVDIVYDHQGLLVFLHDADFEPRTGARPDVHGIERMWSRISEMRATRNA